MSSGEAEKLIIGLVPAHNEAPTIVNAVQSLAPQVDHVIVISDNSTDDTVARARTTSAVVIESVNNTDKKAGALNQALNALLGIGSSPHDLPLLADTDHVIVMDADSNISEGFVARALEEFELTPDTGAVGGIFLGEEGGRILAQLQRNEYVRYAREVGRRGAKAWVLTGTATLLRVDVLRHVAAARRAGTLPGSDGVYDTLALTEDNELTLAIKTLGYKTMSPQECIVQTEVMYTWKDLWHQRTRWQRGAVENLRNYGLTRVTRPYFAQQAMITLGLFSFWLLLGLTIVALVTGTFAIQLFWLGIGTIFILERMITVWKAGPRGRLISATVLIECGYDLFLQAVVLWSAIQILTGRRPTWHHGDTESLGTISYVRGHENVPIN